MFTLSGPNDFHCQREVRKEPSDATGGESWAGPDTASEGRAGEAANCRPGGQPELSRARARTPHSPTSHWEAWVGEARNGEQRGFDSGNRSGWGVKRREGEGLYGAFGKGRMGLCLPVTS